VIVLEEAARAFVSAVPFGNLDELQSGVTAADSVEATDLVISGGLPIRIYRPAAGPLPVVLYVHGGGWAAGGTATHDRIVRELAVRSGAAIVFPSFSLSPSVRYPVALEEVYRTLQWIAAEGSRHRLYPPRIALAGDSSGGNLATAVALLAKRRGGPRIAAQLLYYPVTDAGLDTGSYQEFATGYWLTRDAMRHFWDRYAPDPARRAEVTASPLRATTDDLAGMPRTLIVVAEADVLRDEGEAYAAKLRSAGVDVTAARYLGITHDFVMLNALKDTAAARAATAQGGAFLRAALWGQR
jgi:acetyl esterase